MIDMTDMFVQWRSLLRTPGARMEFSGAPEEGETTTGLQWRCNGTSDGARPEWEAAENRDGWELDARNP
jgi:hypothetical protein